MNNDIKFTWRTDTERQRAKQLQFWGRLFQAIAFIFLLVAIFHAATGGAE